MIRPKQFISFTLLILGSIFTYAAGTNFYYKQKVNLQLKPSTFLSEKLGELWRSDNKEDPIFTAEALYSIPKKENGMTMKEMSQLVRSFSKMEGLIYYSNTRKRNAILYTESYSVDNPISRKRIDDNTSDLSKNCKLYAYQYDNSFGGSLYEVNILENDNEILLANVNLDVLKYGLINLVEKRSIYTSILITDCKDSYSIYILTQGNFPSLPFIDSLVRKSFTARLDAVYEWFMGKYNETK